MYVYIGVENNKFILLYKIVYTKVPSDEKLTI